MTAHRFAVRLSGRRANGETVVREIAGATSTTRTRAMQVAERVRRASGGSVYSARTSVTVVDLTTNEHILCASPCDECVAIAAAELKREIESPEMRELLEGLS